jgi:hypothetical protein
MRDKQDPGGETRENSFIMLNFQFCIDDLSLLQLQVPLPQLGVIRRDVRFLESLMVLQRCYNGVTMVLQWCYNGGTMVLQWCSSGVPVL